VTAIARALLARFRIMQEILCNPNLNRRLPLWLRSLKCDTPTVRTCQEPNLDAIYVVRVPNRGRPWFVSKVCGPKHYRFFTYFLVLALGKKFSRTQTSKLVSPVTKAKRFPSG
jgi:hypothetical protein